MDTQEEKKAVWEEAVAQGGVYTEFLLEREEILRHKWFRSEQEGRDIGFEQALTEWSDQFRETWRKRRKKERDAR